MKREHKKILQVDSYALLENPSKAQGKTRAFLNITSNFLKKLLELPISIYKLGLHTVNSADRIVVKLGESAPEISSATIKRIAGGHDLADRTEGAQQERLQNKEVPLMPVQEIESQISQYDEEFREKGAFFGKLLSKDGKVIFFLISETDKHLIPEIKHQIDTEHMISNQDHSVAAAEDPVQKEKESKQPRKRKPAPKVEKD